MAADLADARQQWVAVFGRDRADLGPGHAAQLAAAEAARYAQPRPLDLVLPELREAWTVEQGCLDRLAVLQARRDTLRAVVALQAAEKLPQVEVLGRAPGAAERLVDVDRNIAAAGRELAGARERIAALMADPTLLDQPADRLLAERNAWCARDADRSPFSAAPRPPAVHPGLPRPESERRVPSRARCGASPGLGR